MNFALKDKHILGLEHQEYDNFDSDLIWIDSSWILNWTTLVDQHSRLDSIMDDYTTLSTRIGNGLDWK